MLRTILIVGTGGFTGSVLRYLLQILVEKWQDSTFPLGTFIANILGSLIIGAVFALAEKGDIMSPEWRIFMTVGFCGGFTTFSAFAYNNLNMLKDNAIYYLLLNIGGSLTLGILAVYLGIILIRTIL
ncbi:Fluoride ion transporter CrcB [hydrothermal vent metagenome]|uniref:Fluoride ion transporter CrcB n=1 Tax=hydrothermal vent metagenome TaxID=652676 RepID=A0A3B0UNR4_9ZZZZ